MWNWFSVTLVAENQFHMDKLYMLQSEDDVATQKLGKWYRLPSDEDWQELLDNCTWEPITATVLTETVVAGWKVKG